MATACGVPVVGWMEKRHGAKLDDFELAMWGLWRRYRDLLEEDATLRRKLRKTKRKARRARK